MRENEIGREVVDAAIAVHRQVGPGLLESVYEVILVHKLSKRGLHVERQVSNSIGYQGFKIYEGFRADIIVEDNMVLELRSVENITAAHRKQIQKYLRLSGFRLGFLLNFGAALMKERIN
jgi:GxxExxY protein